SRPVISAGSSRSITSPCSSSPRSRTEAKSECHVRGRANLSGEGLLFGTRDQIAIAARSTTRTVTWNTNSDMEKFLHLRVVCHTEFAGRKELRVVDGKCPESHEFYARSSLVPPSSEPGPKELRRIVGSLELDQMTVHDQFVANNRTNQT